MRRILGAAAVSAAAVLLGSPASEAARSTTHLDALEAELTARSADPSLPKKLAKLFRRDLKALGKDTTTLLADVTTAAKVVPALERKAASETTVLSAAGSAVDGLVAEVSARYAQAQTDADLLLGKQQDPLTRLPRVLSSTASRLQLVTTAPTMSQRIRLLLPAARGVSQAQILIAKAKGSNPDPNLCGPTTEYDAWIRQQLRAVAGNESFLADVTDARGMYAFEADTVLALAGPQMGFPGAMEVLDFRGYDCEERSGVQFTIPFPPSAGTTYTQANGASGGYQADYDGIIEVFPQGNRVTVDTVDLAAETVTGTFSFGGVANGRFTIRGWQPPLPFVPPPPPGPPAKPEGGR